MITAYFVCYGNSTQELQDNVSNAIQNGWQPIGGVSVIAKSWFQGRGQEPSAVFDEMFYQAVVMIK